MSSTRHLWLRSSILSMLIIVAAFSNLSAAKIYMAPPPTGNDQTGDGSRQNPYATLEKCSESIIGAYDYTQLAGDTIILLPGTYPHETTFIGFDTYFRGKDEDNPLVIMGDPEAVAQGNKPVYDGQFDSAYGTAIPITQYYSNNHLAVDDAQYLVFRNIKFKDFYYYGMNIDDGGENSRATPAHHIIIDSCDFETGIGHFRHGLKMSGVDNFEVMNCTFVGIRYNCIDGVGIHDGHIHDNIFRDCQTGLNEGNGVMCKGGSRDVLVEKNIFRNLSIYGVQIGQTTDAHLVRPPYGELDADGEIMDYEAKDIDVFRNIFINVSTPIKWDCARGGRVYQNTFYTPQDYTDPFGASRMLVINQIHTHWDGFELVQCRDGEFRNNVIYFGRTEGYPNNRVVWVQNPDTQPETFVFSNNLWYCHADPDNSIPDWETLEGLYGSPQHFNDYAGDPLFVNSSNPTDPQDFIVQNMSPAVGMGTILDAVQYDFFDRLFYSPPTLGAFEIFISGGTPINPRSVDIEPE